MVQPRVLSATAVIVWIGGGPGVDSVGEEQGLETDLGGHLDTCQ